MSLLFFFFLFTGGGGCWGTYPGIIPKTYPGIELLC